MKQFTVNCSKIADIEITLISEGIQFERKGTCFTCELSEGLYEYLKGQDDICLKDVSDEIQKKAKAEVFHSKFDVIVKLLSNNTNVYLFGPAGTGKSHIAKQAAEALGLDFYPESTMLNAYDITGFVDANGAFHETQFYRAYKNGGEYAPDEFDGCPPEVGIKLNMALANGYFIFGNGEYVKMHPNFRCIVSGNTVGTGATEEYNGRQALDAATLDRFQPICIEYDKNLEMIFADGNRELVDFVDDFRKAIKECKLNHIVSYRGLKRLVEYEKLFDLESAISMALKADEYHLGKRNMEQVFWRLTTNNNKYTNAYMKLCNI